MLRSREDFARLGTSGRVRSHRLMIVHYLPNALDHDRFGISTSRHLGGAVQRNRVRRRVRQVLRATPGEPGRGWDVLIVARPACTTATFDELRAALQRLLASLRTPLKTTP